MKEKTYPIYELQAKWNSDSTSIRFMTPKRLTLMEEYENIEKFDRKIREQHKIVGNFEKKLVFIEYETWCLVWFNHYSYNNHYSDKEIFKSFEAFVGRKFPMNRALEHSHRDNNNEPHYCLMGAEESWRWNICRCEKCTDRGVVTIDH